MNETPQRKTKTSRGNKKGDRKTDKNRNAEGRDKDGQKQEQNRKWGKTVYGLWM